MSRGEGVTLDVVFMGLAAVSVPGLLGVEWLRVRKVNEKHMATERAYGIVRVLGAYLSAQNQFRRTDFYGKGYLVYANPEDGGGFRDLHQLPDGTVLNMLPHTHAAAVRGGTPYAGYCFADIAYDDYTIDCGLCAYPAQYDGHWFRYTFVIDITGVVYQKDMEGSPVRTYPVDPAAEGWRPVGGG